MVILARFGYSVVKVREGAVKKSPHLYLAKKQGGVRKKMAFLRKYILLACKTAKCNRKYAGTLKRKRSFIISGLSLSISISCKENVA